MIEQAKNISIHRISSGDIDACEIFLNGFGTNKIINGAFLEDAFKWEGGYFILTTQNSWEDPFLEMFLFDENLIMLDSASIGRLRPFRADYCLEKIIQPNKIVISYIKRWSVEFFDHSRLRIPLISEPFDIWREKGFSYHFSVTDCRV